MTQNIILKRGSIELPSGLKLQFEEAEISVGRGVSVVEIPKEFTGKKTKRKYKKRKDKSPDGKKAGVEKYSKKDGGKRRGNEFELEIAGFLNTNSDGFNRKEIESYLKEKGVKFNEKKLINKLYNMKNSGSVGLEDGKYFLDADYFKETSKGNFKLNQ